MDEPTTTKERLKQRGLVRFTFDIPVEDANTLTQLSQDTGYNLTTTVVRAVRILDQLVRATRGGATITITHPNGDKERLLLS